MKTKIGAYDPNTRQVTVTFTHAGQKHERQVNACHAGDSYDAAATVARVAEVAAGVERKMDVGAIVPPPAPTA